MNRKLPIAACLAAAALVLPTSPAAAGSTAPEPDILAENLLSPLRLAVGSHDTVYVTQDFAGLISRVNDDGTTTTVYENGKPGWDVAGVETRGRTTFFVESVGAGGGVPEALEGYLKAIDPWGDVRTIADLASYERDNNPDGDQEYGFGDDVTDECLAGWPAYPPTRYSGAVDSHPYATAVRSDTVYVADAGSNSILEVDKSTGEISTLAVLPPRPVTVPAGLTVPISETETFTVPDCVVGHEYAFEPVPTDVEIGPDGWLYVTSLPGGPEDPSLGARGAIFRVNPWSGETHLWAEEILTPTGLAIADNGDVYVASLFGNEIIKFSCWGNERSQFLAVNLPADVEVDDGKLYATIDALSMDAAGPPDPATPPNGKVIRADIR